ncbi:MAG: hypothetical protein J6P83_00850 [Bacteroidales bacterium]|nr:hypothetical protein [Bacteroidales bacterium]
MSKFIELHLCDKEGTPVLLNVNQIAYITNVKNEVIIYLSIGENDNTNQVIHVKETYEEVKAML